MQVTDKGAIGVLERAKWTEIGSTVFPGMHAGPTMNRDWPEGIAETGLHVCPLEKASENLFAWFDGHFLRFECKTYGIAAIFSDSGGNVARCLCNPDCVAERVGFESSDLLEIKELRGSSQSCFPSKGVVRSF